MTTVAVCQIAPSVEIPDQPYQQIQVAVEKAACRGAHIIVLPELASSGYMFQNRHELESRAEHLDGKTIQQLEQLAAQHHLIIISGLAEINTDRLYNTAVLIDKTGLRTYYRKAHLWDNEKMLGFTPGQGAPPVIDTPHGRVGIMICYDLEFPEWVRIAALNRAALLCAPANWPLFPRPRNERPNEVIRVQANAAVNKMFIAVADRAGTERNQKWLGGSVVVDTDGYPRTQLNLGQEEIMVATLDLEQALDKSISAYNDVHADRRPELYEKLNP